MENIFIWLNDNLYILPYIGMLLIVIYAIIVCISSYKKINIFKNETKEEIKGNYSTYLQKLIAEKIKNQLQLADKDKLLKEALKKLNKEKE